MPILIILCVLAISPWTWQLWQYNSYLFLLSICAAIIFFLSILKISKIFLYSFCLILLPILIIQWKTTLNSNLGYMNATEEQLFNIRRSEIPTYTASIFNQTKIFNLGRFSENRAQYMFYKFEQNLLRNMDLNLFFFGDHPREIPGIREFEKFPFFLLPFFIFGLLKSLKNHALYLLAGFLIPLLELSIIGQNNPVGPFVLFPFFAAIIAIGIFYTTEIIFATISTKDRKK